MKLVREKTGVTVLLIHLEKIARGLFDVEHRLLLLVLLAVQKQPSALLKREETLRGESEESVRSPHADVHLIIFQVIFVLFEFDVLREQLHNFHLSPEFFD